MEMEIEIEIEMEIEMIIRGRAITRLEPLGAEFDGRAGFGRDRAELPDAPSCSALGWPEADAASRAANCELRAAMSLPGCQLERRPAQTVS